MNSTHFHLLLNHFPVIGTMIGSALLLWGIYKRQNTLNQAAALLLFLMALIAIPVFLTGEPAEETVEKLPGVSEAAIEMHESAATLAIWLMELTGIAALAILILQVVRQQVFQKGYFALLLLSFLSFAAMARTGYYGGQIRHTEIQTAGSNAAASGEGQEGKETAKPGKEKKDKDDD